MSDRVCTNSEFGFLSELAVPQRAYQHTDPLSYHEQATLISEALVHKSRSLSGCSLPGVGKKMVKCQNADWFHQCTLATFKYSAKCYISGRLG